MPIWKLSPLDLNDPSWAASSHQGFVIVRARDEAEARATAAAAFDAKTRFSPAKAHTYPPWNRPELVKVEPIKDERYAGEGPATVLEPSF